MLRHLNASPISPKRVVVMGAAGFVGGAVVNRLARDGIPVLALGRRDVDLLHPQAAEKLHALIQADDTFVAVSARAPVRNSNMLVENIIMTGAMVNALAGAPVGHVINVSSDAIYADSPDPLTEKSTTAPGSLHGAMHLARELMFQAEIKAPLAMVRPTLIYGPGDPHNGYGPNRFCRLANRGEDILLFGEGEEQRDHIFIDDVAELIARAICRRSSGTLNLATGEVRSFRNLAERVVRIAGSAATVRGTPRSGPMPHNGYRPFDVEACRDAFPDFIATPMDQGLTRAQKELR